MTDLSGPAQDPGGGADPRVERMDSLYYGKFRGIVVDNKDPDQLGRLRLMVPSVFGGTSADMQELPDTPEKINDDLVTDWAWPCVMAGGLADQGSFFIPDIGAKVWVEFEEGNLDCPLWVGTVWAKPSDSEIPKEAKNMVGNKPQRRVLKTSSGHVLEFSDVDGKETITIRHKNKAMLHFNEKGSVTISLESGTLIYLNAEEKELCIADENGNNVRLGDSNVTLTNKSGTVVDIADKAVQVIAKNVMLRSETVQLGEGAMEPAILGRTFAAIFDAHTHPTAFGPSGPPIPAPMPLSAPTNPAISKAVTVL
jgi:uncharacterized protein involved in type VI secretion and phage assembly